MGEIKEERMRLEDLVDFQTGEIVTRLEKRGRVGPTGDIRLYERAVFSREFGLYEQHSKARYLTMEDGNDNLKLLHAGDGVVSIMTGEMVVSSGLDEDNYPLTLTANFAAVHNRNPDQLDMNYLAYWFNQDDDALRQLALVDEVSSTTIKRLNMRRLKDLQIKLPKLELQQRIGKMYQASLQRNLNSQEKTVIEQQIELAQIHEIAELAKVKQNG